MSPYPSRRLRRLYVSPEVLVCACEGRFEVVSNPVPKGAQVVGVHYNDDLHMWNIVISHESFDELENGRGIPEMSGPLLRTLEPSADAHTQEYSAALIRILRAKIQRQRHELRQFNRRYRGASDSDIRRLADALSR
jgi:hypothetical protein